ncbi:MAG: hypothetical protein Q9218_007029 [Villophora microphyllina]
MAPAAPAAGAISAVGSEAAASSSFLASKGSTLVSFVSNFPTNVGGDAIDHAICKDFANEAKMLEDRARVRIQTDMAHFYEEYREIIQGTNSEILKGKETSSE